VSDAKFMLANSKFKPGKDLTHYNLTDETCYAKLEISSFDGRTEKVYIGCPTLSGTEVYVKHSEKNIEGYRKRLFLCYLEQKKMNKSSDKRYCGVMYDIGVSKPAVAAYYLKKLEKYRQKKSQCARFKIFSFFEEEGEKHSYGEEKNNVNDAVLSVGFDRFINEIFAESLP
jgi:hypothetical protein